MSNSTLVDYTKISPNRTSPRNHAIDTITIHCVVGQCSVETLGNIFAPTSRQASSNYGVGVDGRIGMYVEEKDRSWCSSNAANDNRAITIEVASDTAHPYAVNAKAYAALLDLVTDICRRNGIKKLVWSTNKNERVNHLNGCNMTVHRDYANKSCPGDYLYERHGAIAAEVNKGWGFPGGAGNAFFRSWYALQSADRRFQAEIERTGAGKEIEGGWFRYLRREYGRLLQSTGGCVQQEGKRRRYACKAESGGIF